LRILQLDTAAVTIAVADKERFIALVAGTAAVSSNVIVHGVPESDADDADRRTDDDMTVLTAMFHEVEADDIKVGSVVRLGKKAANPKQNPRPMKVVLDSVDNKVKLLRKAKNLREKEERGWTKVFIHQDLTPKQREARKPLVAELKQRKANGETDLTIYRGAVVKEGALADFNELVCVYLNARGLMNKLDEFEAWIAAIDPDVVGVTET